ncbi:MAG: hypothetical protein ABFC80_09630 [Coriobacteriales bacterium]|nr:hypothetical protein [Actinomycetes bacterium]
MKRGIALAILAALAVAVLVSGCQGRAKPVERQTGTSSTLATAPGGSAEVSGSAGGPSASAEDVSAIKAELLAIERELDAMDMPDDGDFSTLEGDLE